MARGLAARSFSRLYKMTLLYKVFIRYAFLACSPYKIFKNNEKETKMIR